MKTITSTEWAKGLAGLAVFISSFASAKLYWLSMSLALLALILDHIRMKQERRRVDEIRKKLTPKFDTKAIFGVEESEILAFDFLTHFDIMMIAKKDGTFVRFKDKAISSVELTLPFEMCGFWSYPKSIINMDESEEGLVSATRYLVSRPIKRDL